MEKGLNGPLFLCHCEPGILTIKTQMDYDKFPFKMSSRIPKVCGDPERAPGLLLRSTHRNDLQETRTENKTRH